LGHISGSSFHFSEYLRDRRYSSESGGINQRKKIREDLYFRLQVFPILIPPLRERKVDVPALVHHFLIKKTRDLGFSRIPDISPGALDRLLKYQWPGNVRELENMVERAFILNPAGPIQFEDPSDNQVNEQSQTRTIKGEEPIILDQVVFRHIQQILKMTDGKIKGKNGAAELLGINASTLRYLLG